MNKHSYFRELRNKLSKFSSKEVENIIIYYDEIIEEKKEAGMSEENAIASLGDINNIVNTVSMDLMMKRSEDKKTKPLRNFIIILGICASPILLPIGIAFFAIVFSLIIVILALFIAFTASSLAVFVATLFMLIEMLNTGITTSVIVLYAGVGLTASGVLILLTVLSLKIGSLVLNALNRSFSKLIKTKTGGVK